MKRLALLALLASPLPAQEFPGGSLGGMIVTVMEWEGAPAVLLVKAPMGQDPPFAWIKQPFPGSWSLRVVAAAVFDSRPCALAGRFGPAIPSIHRGSDMPGHDMPRMNATGLVVQTWPRVLHPSWPPELFVPLYFDIQFDQGGFGCPWRLGYCNTRSECPPCPPIGNGPEFYALVLRVVVK